MTAGRHDHVLLDGLRANEQPQQEALEWFALTIFERVAADLETLGRPFATWRDCRSSEHERANGDGVRCELDRRHATDSPPRRARLLHVMWRRAHHVAMHASRRRERIRSPRASDRDERITSRCAHQVHHVAASARNTQQLASKGCPLHLAQARRGVKVSVLTSTFSRTRRPLDSGIAILCCAPRHVRGGCFRQPPPIPTAHWMVVRSLSAVNSRSGNGQSSLCGKPVV
jgi:hypothetical protein